MSSMGFDLLNKLDDDFGFLGAISTYWKVMLVLPLASVTVLALLSVIGLGKKPLSSAQSTVAPATGLPAQSLTLHHDWRTGCSHDSALALPGYHYACSSTPSTVTVASTCWDGEAELLARIAAGVPLMLMTGGLLT